MRSPGSRARRTMPARAFLFPTAAGWSTPPGATTRTARGRRHRPGHLDRRPLRSAEPRRPQADRACAERRRDQPGHLAERPARRSAGGDGTVRLWDLEAGRSRRFARGRQHRPSAGLLRARRSDRRATAFRRDDPPARPEDGRRVDDVPGSRAADLGARLLPRRPRLVSCGTDHTIRVWDVETGQEIAPDDARPRRERHRRLPGRPARLDWQLGLDDRRLGPGDRPATPPDRRHRQRVRGRGRRLARRPPGAVRGTKTVVALGPRDRRGDRAAGRAHRRRLDVAFSPDGRRAVSSSLDKTVRVWALPGGGRSAR